MIAFDEIQDLDSGVFMGYILDGHHESDVATAIVWGACAQEGIDETFEQPRRTWVRKVPYRDDYGHFGQFRYVYGAPGRGAKAVTVLEVARAKMATCCLCPWDAVIGLPRLRFLNPPPVAAVPGRRADEYVYLCRGHQLALNTDDYSRPITLPTRLKAVAA